MCKTLFSSSIEKKHFKKKIFPSQPPPTINYRLLSTTLYYTILCQGCENKVFAIISKKAVVSYYYYILHNYHCTKKTHFYGCDYVSKSNKKAILIRNLLFCVHFKSITKYGLQFLGRYLGKFVKIWYYLSRIELRLRWNWLL